MIRVILQQSNTEKMRASIKKMRDVQISRCRDNTNVKLCRGRNPTEVKAAMQKRGQITRIYTSPTTRKCINEAVAQINKAIKRNNAAEEIRKARRRCGII